MLYSLAALRAGNVIIPEAADEFRRTFKVVRTFPCDVWLGDHTSQFGLAEKYPLYKPGAPNPYLDKASCHHENDVEEAMFHAIMAEQQKAAAQP